MILLLASWTKVLVWLNSSPCAHPGTPRRFTALTAFPKASLPQHLGQSNSIIFTETAHVHHFQQSKWVMPHPWLSRAGINTLCLTREQKVGSEAGRGWCQLHGLASEPAGHQSSPDRKWQQHVELLEPATSSPCSRGAVPVAPEMSGLEWKGRLHECPLLRDAAWSRSDGSPALCRGPCVGRDGPRAALPAAFPLSPTALAACST